MNEATIADTDDVWAVKGSPDSDEFSMMEYWMAHPVVKRRQNQRFSGSQSCNWHQYAFNKYLSSQDQSSCHILSVGCGNGDLERILHRNGAFAYCDAFDYSRASIERAIASAKKEGINTINYFTGDGNTIRLEKEKYDVVIFNMSLHHIDYIEHLLGEVRNSLKPGGKVFAHEYVGPNRFDFTTRQKEAMRAMHALIPQRFLMTKYGICKPAICYPDPKDVILDDPTESIRSSEIPRLLNDYFHVLETRRGLGTTLQFLLAGIAGNFREDDPDGMRVLNMLLNIEETLLDTHELEADFVLIIAERNKNETNK